MLYKKKEVGKIWGLVLSSVAGVAASVLFICAVSAVLLLFPSPVKAVKPLCVLALFLSYFVSGIISDRITSLGAVGGLIVSSFLAVVSLSLSLIFGKSDIGTAILLVLKFGFIGIGAFGGFLSSKIRGSSNAGKKYRRLMAKR